MPKSYWTPIEKAALKKLVDSGFDDLYIAKKLNKSKNAVQIKRNRTIGSFIFCYDCGIKVKNKGGKRLRCKSCADKRIENEKKSRAAKWYSENKEMRRFLRDQLRFGGNREIVIKRDGEVCVVCGLTREQHYEKYHCDLTVDHKDGNGRNSKEQNNSVDNLQSMCLSCHGKKDAKRRRKDWSMCAEVLKKYWEKQKENNHKSISELLLSGKSPGKNNGKINWK